MLDIIFYQDQTFFLGVSRSANADLFLTTLEYLRWADCHEILVHELGVPGMNSTSADRRMPTLCDLSLAVVMENEIESVLLGSLSGFSPSHLHPLQGRDPGLLDGATNQAHRSGQSRPGPDL